MSRDGRVFLNGSKPHHEKWAGHAIDPSVELEVLVLLRSNESVADWKLVRQFAATNALTALRRNPVARTIILRGAAERMSKAFGVKILLREHSGRTFRSHREALTIPAELEGIVVGVFGLDDRPMASRPRRAGSPPPESLLPPPVNKNTRQPKAFRGLYQFPHATGKGECIAVLEFGGGFNRRQLHRQLAELGVVTPEIVIREIGKGRNLPASIAGELTPTTEVNMDLEILASMAPDATLVVYFAENNNRGWVEALHAAIFDEKHRPSVISISWGQAEQFWDAQTIAAMEAALRIAAEKAISVCCSSGDRGVFEAGTPYTVPYPASSAFVLACGGTRLDVGASGKTTETVWNQSAAGVASGGGISQLFEVPAFQQRRRIPAHALTGKRGRGIPDVAANASSETGYLIIADGTSISLGGTSAAAPLWAGLIACLSQARGQRVGYLTPLLYTGKPGAAVRKILRGNNRLGGREGYRAQRGWDACTGLGSPNGVKLLTWLKRLSAGSH